MAIRRMKSRFYPYFDKFSSLLHNFMMSVCLLFAHVSVAGGRASRKGHSLNVACWDWCAPEIIICIMSLL